MTVVLCNFATLFDNFDSSLIVISCIIKTYYVIINLIKSMLCMFETLLLCYYGSLVVSNHIKPSHVHQAED